MNKIPVTSVVFVRFILSMCAGDASDVRSLKSLIFKWIHIRSL